MDELVEQKKKENLFPLRDPKQYASAARTLSMTNEELEAYHNRPLPSKDDWKREIVERKITPQEYFTHKGLQHDEKRNDVAQPDLPTLSEEKKAEAVSAFMETPGVSLTPQEIRKIEHYGFYDLDPYGTRGPKEEWVELPWYKAFYHWLKGTKIESTTMEGSKDWRDFMNQSSSDTSKPSGTKS